MPNQGESHTQREGPRTASGALRRATHMLRRGRYEEALSSLDQALSLGADPYDCYMRQAEVYQTLGMHDMALSAAAKAVEVHPRGLSAHEKLVSLHLKVGDYEGAIEAVRPLLKLVPRSVEARNALSLAYVGTGDFYGALRVTSEMVRLDPANPLHRLKRAMILEHLDDAGHAIEDIMAALELIDDAGLAADVRQHLESLDSAEIDRVLGLAEEDVVFRIEVIRDPRRATEARGFALSPWGLERLEAIVLQMARDPGPSGPLRRYH